MGAVLHLHGGPAPPPSPPGWAPVAEADLEEALVEGEVDVVVVAPTACRPVEALQRVHALAPHAQAVVEARPGDEGRLGRELRYAPGLPGGLRLLEEDDPLETAVREARAQAARSRRYGALQASVLAQLPDRSQSRVGPGMTAVGALLEHAPLGAVVTDAGGLLRAWNDKAAELLGLDQASTGSPLADRFEDPDPVLAALAAAGSSLRRIADVAVETPETPEGGGRELEVSFAPTRSEDDQPAVLGLVLDLTARRRAERARDELAGQVARGARAQAFLLEAWDATAHTASYADTLEALAAVAVPTLGELCLIDVLDEGGRPRRMVARHVDPDEQPLVDELRRRYPPAAGGRHPMLQALDDGRPRWSPTATPELLASIARDEGHLEILRRLGFSGFITVPLRSGSRPLGTVSFVSCGGRHFTEEDLRLAEALAERVATVVDKARLYDREHLVAVSLQRAMQTALPELPGIEAEARYLPARDGSEVGGDWYDLFRLPDGRIGVVIGDVAGHDLAAAGRMGQLRNLLRALAFDRREPPERIVGRLDRLNERLGVTELTTLLYGTLEGGPEGGPEGGLVLEWVNAGHLPPVLLAADGTARLLADSPAAPIGVPGRVRRQQPAVTIPPGATLVLYTDGLVERRGSGIDPGLSALVGACTAGSTLPLDALVDRVLEALGPTGEDDIALLALRPRTTPAG